jgi:enterochelin esterase-like enzyme
MFSVIPKIRSGASAPIPVLFLFLFVIQFLLLTSVPAVYAQEAPVRERFPAVADLLAEFSRIGQISDENMRTPALNELWRQVRAGGHIPYTDKELALMLYRGGADRVDWRGDFNRWGNESRAESVHAARTEAGVHSGDVSAGDPGEDNHGEGILIPGTDVWYTTITLPCDARVDYKIVINGADWMLDPVNPELQYGGAGPNSVLAMPCYEAPAETQLRYDINRGLLSNAYTFSSQALGYEVLFYVYFPHEYQETNAYPVIYVTDGHEYADDALGGMVNILDNAIADSLIPPVMAIFLDPRNPYGGENRRMDELMMNPRYAAFLAEELVPAVDETFATSVYDGDRAIMGTSLGGLNAAYVVLNYSYVFGRAALHSPAFWPRQEILDLYRDSRRLPVSYYISAGTIYDGLELATEFRDILHDGAFHMRFVTTNEGHSWGQWRGQILPALRFFWGGE